MNTERLPDTQTQPNKGWTLLFAVALLQAVASLFLLLASGPATFEADTGVAWSELSGIFPTVATQFVMAQQASLVANLALGLFSVLVIYFAFRSGQRWAWFAMWILPVSMIPGTVSLLRTENQAGAAVFGIVFILITIAGLLISFRAFFPRQTEGIGKPTSSPDALAQSPELE